MTNPQRLAIVRSVHTAIYLVIAGSVFAVLYAAIFGAYASWLPVALALVAIEIVVFVGNGMTCPLTAVATKYGANAGDDTFLPQRLTQYTLKFFGPLIAISAILFAARWCGILG